MFGKCCCQCDICEDDFDRSNSSDVSTGSDCGWTEVAGDWSIASNVLSISSADAALSLNASVGSNFYARVDAGVASGKKSRLACDFVDEDNYLAAEFELTAASQTTCRIIRRASGVESVLAVSPHHLTTTGVLELRFSHHTDAGRVAVEYIFTDNGVGWINHFWAYETVSTNKLAIACGSNSGTITFNDFSVVKSIMTAPGVGSTCLQVPSSCLDCAQEIELEIIGLANNSCGSCTSLNTTYTLTLAGAENTIGGSATRRCYWIYELPSAICGVKWAMVYVDPTRGWVARLSNYNTVRPWDSSYGFVAPAGHMIYEWSLETTWDEECLEIEEMTLNTFSATTIGNTCTRTGSTAVVRLP